MTQSVKTFAANPDYPFDHVVEGKNLFSQTILWLTHTCCSTCAHKYIYTHTHKHIHIRHTHKIHDINKIQLKTHPALPVVRAHKNYPL